MNQTADLIVPTETAGTMPFQFGGITIWGNSTNFQIFRQQFNSALYNPSLAAELQSSPCLVLYISEEISVVSGSRSQTVRSACNPASRAIYLWRLYQDAWIALFLAESRQLQQANVLPPTQFKPSPQAQTFALPQPTQPLKKYIQPPSYETEGFWEGERLYQTADLFYRDAIAEREIYQGFTLFGSHPARSEQKIVLYILSQVEHIWQNMVRSPSRIYCALTVDWETVRGKARTPGDQMIVAPFYSILDKVLTTYHEWLHNNFPQFSHKEIYSLQAALGRFLNMPGKLISRATPFEYQSLLV